MRHGSRGAGSRRHRIGAAPAKLGMRGVLSDSCVAPPAAGALGSLGGLKRGARFQAFGQRERGQDEKLLQLALATTQGGEQLGVSHLQRDGCLQ